MSSPTADTRRPGRATVSSGGRLLGVDAARAVALIGMMATHLEPRIGPDGETTTAYLIASGRASALFALLAGVGLALASGGTTPPAGRAWGRAAAGTAARAAVLFVVGLILGAFDSGLAVILCYYGVLFLVAIPFLRLPAGWLLALGAVAAIVTPVVSHSLRESVHAPLAIAVPSAENLALDPGGTFVSLLLTGYYPVLTWTTYLLVGLGVGRLALGRTRVAAVITAGGAVLAVTSWYASSRWLQGGGLETLDRAGLGEHVASGPIGPEILHTGFYGTTPTTSWWWLAIASPHSGAPPDLIHTSGTALAVLGFMLLLAHVLRRGIWPLAAVGSMTFTLYSLHVVLVATALPATTENALLIHVVIAFVIAVPWRLFVGRGPLEALAAGAARAARGAVRA